MDRYNISKRIAVLTSKVVPIYTMKAYRETEDRAPQILTLVKDGDEWLGSRYGRFTPSEINSSPTEWKAVWAPQQVCTFWRRDKSLVTAEIGPPYRPARSTVAALTTLCCFPNIKIHCVIF
jgi:hypothetical protein